MKLNYNEALIGLAVTTVTSELSKKGFDNDGWATCSPEQLCDLLVKSIARNDWRAMVVYSLMMETKSSNAAYHIDGLISRLMSDASKSHTNICQLQKLNNDKNVKINELNIDKNQLTEKIKDLEESNKFLEAGARCDTDTVKRLKGEIDALASEIGRMSVELVNTQTELQKAKEKVKMSADPIIRPVSIDIVESPDDLRERLLKGESIAVSSGYQIPFTPYEPPSRFNCRCRSVPVVDQCDNQSNETPKQLVKISASVTKTVNGAEIRYDLHGTTEEVISTMREMGAIK